MPHQKFEYNPSERSIGATIGWFSATRSRRVDERVRNTSASRNYMQSNGTIRCNVVAQVLGEYDENCRILKECGKMCTTHEYVIGPYLSSVVERLLLHANHMLVAFDGPVCLRILGVTFRCFVHILDVHVVVVRRRFVQEIL